MNRRRRRQVLPVVAAIAVLWCSSVADLAAEVRVEFLIDSEPDIAVPIPTPNVHPEMKGLWLTALQRPEVDLQRMTAESIARAKQIGVLELTEAVPRLEEILRADGSHPAARFAAARALIVLDSRASGEMLWEAAQTRGADLRHLIEPAIARWEIPSARLEWMKRLERADTRLRDLHLAIQGLGQVGETTALPLLLEFVHDSRREPATRLEAAAAAGLIVETGLTTDADRLVQNNRTSHSVNPLCAVRLLSRHSDREAQRLLLDLAGHQEPAVAAAALRRLNEIDASLVVPLAEAAMKHADPRIRREGARACLELPAVDRMLQLTQLLADPHPQLRREVCEGLVRLSAEPEFVEPILQGGLPVLNGDRWEGQEQAALLLGARKSKLAAARLVELLEAPRVEVQVSAAWALREIAMPETIPPMIDRARRITQRRRTFIEPGDDEQVALIFEACGVMNAAESAPLLHQYLSKDFYSGDRSRGAAIWAIGRLMAGKRDADLEAALAARILDFADREPETPLVKQMSAVALVRMRATELAPLLRDMVERTAVFPRLAATMRWGVKQLTCEEMPPLEPRRFESGSWFLKPIP
jgi:HEAT repeat protein